MAGAAVSQRQPVSLVGKAPCEAPSDGASSRWRCGCAGLGLALKLSSELFKRFLTIRVRIRHEPKCPIRPERVDEHREALQIDLVVVAVDLQQSLIRFQQLGEGVGPLDTKSLMLDLQHLE